MLHFEERVARLREYLRCDHRYDSAYLARPFIAEFTGSPSSGKTTCITELDKGLRRLKLRVWRPQEGAEVIRHIERTTPVYNIRTGLYALTTLLDVCSGHQYDVVLLDRGVFDVHTWMMYWQDKNQLTEEEKILIQSFFQLRFWIEKVDVAYFMICDPKKAMERELKIALTDTMGDFTNHETITKLANRYKNAYEELKGRHPQLHLIDTTDLSEEAMVNLIAEKTLLAFEKHLPATAT